MRSTFFNKKVLFLFLLGGILGPVLDGIHVYSDTLAYPHPHILRTAIWVIPLFASAVLGISLSHIHFDQLFNRKRRNLSRVFVASGLLSFILIYFISGFWNTDSITKTIVLAFLSITFWMIWDRSWQGGLLAIITALVGCGVEILLSSSGAFFYLKPDYLNIPYWLFFLYIPASISVGNLSRKLHYT